MAEGVSLEQLMQPGADQAGPVGDLDTRRRLEVLADVPANVTKAFLAPRVIVFKWFRYSSNDDH